MDMGHIDTFTACFLQCSRDRVAPLIFSAMGCSGCRIGRVCCSWERDTNLRALIIVSAIRVREHWIPAFAGMTNFQQVARPRHAREGGHPGRLVAQTMIKANLRNRARGA